MQKETALGIRAYLAGLVKGSELYRRPARSFDFAQDDRPGEGHAKNIRFCETNPNCFGAFFNVTVGACVVCVGNVENSIRVRFPERTHFRGSLTTEKAPLDVFARA